MNYSVIPIAGYSTKPTQIVYCRLWDRPNMKLDAHGTASSTALAKGYLIG